jgi:hypothetical protein
MNEGKKKATDLGGGQQPEKDMSRTQNTVTLAEDEVKHVESLILQEIYRRDYAACNWQSHHYA